MADVRFTTARGVVQRGATPTGGRRGQTLVLLTRLMGRTAHGDGARARAATHHAMHADTTRRGAIQRPGTIERSHMSFLFHMCECTRECSGY